MVEDQAIPDDQNLNTSPRLFAGFTFIGQFIDHDITFDNTPLDQQLADPDAKTNFRTPRYDLDSVYGRGPAAEPQFYDPADRDKLLVTLNVNGVEDMPRGSDGQAIIPEHRNDENLIVVQLHKAVAKFHNRAVDDARAQGVRREWVFETARRLTRWHYQWAVIHDFLPRFIGDELVGPNGAVYKEVAGKPPVITLTYYRPTNRDGRPFMPIEFAVAAYRFGHSMIRGEYEGHDQLTLPIFGAEGKDLRGSRPFPADLRIDWNYFFELPGVQAPDDRNFARLIDTQLSMPLASLPPTVVAPASNAITALAARNLLRGKYLGLGSGQDVAAAMKLTPLSNADLGLTDSRLGGKAPLWFYILKEAELLGGQQLGPVGGRIVAEVILGLLTLQPSSYFNAKKPFAPATPDFKMGNLLQLAGAATPSGSAVGK
jgi:hypothetical protein